MHCLFLCISDFLCFLYLLLLSFISKNRGANMVFSDMPPAISGA